MASMRFKQPSMSHCRQAASLLALDMSNDCSEKLKKCRMDSTSFMTLWNNGENAKEIGFILRICFQEISEKIRIGKLIYKSMKTLTNTGTNL